MDRVVVDLGKGFWLGRAHPLGQEINPYSALGDAWGQNQSDALHPRVAGWVSVGGKWELTPHSVLRVAASPLFLPTFGPRMSLSASESASGSYFSSLPPDRVHVGGTELPLRYNLQTGNLADILFRPQAFVSWTEKMPIGFLTLLSWSAPAPDPSTSADAILRIQGSGVQAVATVVPEFRRENYLGVSFDARHGAWEQHVQLLEELSRSVPTVSATVAYWPTRAIRAQFGVLHRFDQESDSPVTSARRDDRLTTAEVRAFFLEGWNAALTFQRNWTGSAPGQWTEFVLRRAFSHRVSGELRTSILSGSDGSYFGNWRALDQLGVGVRLAW